MLRKDLIMKTLVVLFQAVEHNKHLCICMYIYCIYSGTFNGAEGIGATLKTFT